MKIKDCTGAATEQLLDITDIQDHPNFVVGVTDENTDEIVTLVFRTKQGVFRLTADTIELVTPTLTMPVRGKEQYEPLGFYS